MASGSPASTPARATGRRAALRHVGPGWFGVPLGLAGMGLAWFRAQALFGPSAQWVAAAWGALGLLAFLMVAGVAVWRLQHHPKAWRDDLQHPARHPLIAMAPAALLVLTALALAVLGEDAAPGTPARALIATAWWAGSLGQAVATVWVLSRWFRGPAGAAGSGFGWPAVTPALFVPVVGNVLAPLAGQALGHAGWATAQFGVGLFFWPLVAALLAVRLAVAGPWPARLEPTVFIFVAPPAAGGTALLQLGAPLPLAWGAWGVALTLLAWALTRLPVLRQQAFSITHWALSFPFAALAGLTMILAGAEGGGAMRLVAMLALVAASLVVAALLLATWRGLRGGTLLQAEPVAVIQPVGR